MNGPAPGHGPEDPAASMDARVGELAQFFMERYRRGEKVTIEEYAASHPELAQGIRELFPVLCVLEELGPADPDAGPAPDLDLGSLQRLGEYRLIREIGRGGMGVVYEAEQETLQRRVALKVLPFQAFQDPRQLDRFRMEAQAAARLNHPNIVPVFGVGEDRGIHYYAMQFIRGQTIAEVLSEVRRLRGMQRPEGEGRSRQSPAQAPVNDTTTSIARETGAIYFRGVARIALQVAEALAYAHGEGVLHRDIKPSNLILDLRGAVWITDFGLAKLQDSADSTVTGNLAGTIRYMAPERLRGEGDARSDVYSLGISLYELLTLRPAFAASERAMVMQEIAGREPPAPRRADASIPRDFETIVLKAIAKEPRHRYASAAALAGDLRRFLNREPLAARRVRAPERLWRWCQRNPAIASLSGVSALLLIFLAAGGLFSAVTLRLERDRTIERLAASKLQEGRALRLSREHGRRSMSIAALREAARDSNSGEVRNQLISSLALVDLEEVSSRDLSGLLAVAGRSGRAAIASPDGSLQIFADLAAAAPEAALPGSGRPAAALSFSPDNRYLAEVDRDNLLILWDLRLQKPAFQTALQGGHVPIAFDPQSRSIAIPSEDGDIIIRSLADGGELQRLKNGFQPSRLAFDPSGRKLAESGAGFNGQVVLIQDLDAGKFSAIFHFPCAIYSLAWHPEGRILAAGGEDFKVHLRDTVTQERAAVLEGHLAEVNRLHYSPDGEFLASSGYDGRTLLWNAKGNDLLAEAFGVCDAFSADSRHLYFLRGARSISCWRITGGEVFRSLPAPMSGKGPLYIDFSPDGRWLAAACMEQGARLWRMDRRGPGILIPGDVIFSVHFSASGETLWTGGNQGLCRWPLRPPKPRAGQPPEDAGEGEWALGPPDIVYRGRCGNFGLSSDGRLAAILPGFTPTPKILICDLEAGGAVIRTLEQRRSICPQFSPSGRWLIASSWQARDVSVWETGGFSRVRAFDHGTALARFSPDERTLAVSDGARLTFYETSAWERRSDIPKRRDDDLPSPLQYSPDGKYIAMGRSRYLVTLIRAEDGAELARFEAPARGFSLTNLAFSADSRFLAASTEQHQVHLWNLGRIRRELAALELDWSPGEPIPEDAAAVSCGVRVDPGSLAAGAWHEKENRLHNELIDLLARRIELDPSPGALFDRAAAFERFEDPLLALADLDQALAMAPGLPEALDRRARLRHRLGFEDQAAADCDRLLEIIRAGDTAAGSPQTGGAGPGRGAGSGRGRAGLLDTLRLRAAVLEGLGPERIEDARRDSAEALTLDPADAETCHHFAWLSVISWVSRREGAAPGSGAPAGAAQVLERADQARRANPASGAFRRTHGLALYHQGRLEEARETLQEVRTHFQAIYTATFYLAMIEHRLGDAEKARRLFEEGSAVASKKLPEGNGQRAIFENFRAYTELTLKSFEAGDGQRKE